jgi:hypothetical protein
MKSKQTGLNNLTDFKDENGLWLKCYNPALHVKHTTRAWRLWLSLTNRCKVGGNFQHRNPTYVGTTNEFKDFQEFAGWCQSQYGYNNKEDNGYSWQLDKDLKTYCNKVYSKEACIFVPQRINSLLTTGAKSRGAYARGVSCYERHQTEGMFRGDCRSFGKQKYLGFFTSEQEAHKAWQKAKVDVIRKICIEDEEVRNHLELVPILLANAQRIEDDMLNDRETKA